MNKSLSNLMKRQEGFTAVEIITVVAILSVVAYLVLPLVFPGDALTTQEKADKDLTQISQILKERERIAKLNGNIDGIQIGNPGAYSQYTRVSFEVEVDPAAEALRYCLTGLVDGTVFYHDSITQTTSSTPIGFCLGEDVAPAGGADVESEEETPAAGSETLSDEEAPSLTEQPSTELEQ